MQLVSPEFRLEFREFCVGLALRQIDDVFSLAEIQKGELPSNRIMSGQRRTLIEEYYSGIDWDSEEHVKKFLNVVRIVFNQSFWNEQQRDFLRELFVKEGLNLTDAGIISSLSQSSANADLFQKQFPVGLPFGLKKPSFSIAAKDDGQLLKFEMEAGIGVIWGGVYPDFSFQSFREACGLDINTDHTLRKSLFAMNQTESEKIFFKSYAQRFDMAEKNIPMLVPQAWIQWHSQPKKNLRSANSSHADELYRVDFVVFWQNRRYAILVDDISHYAVKKNNTWLANEEKYSQRLKEDRRLQQQNWLVYRISNWEIRDEDKLKEMVAGLADFVGFNSLTAVN